MPSSLFIRAREFVYAQARLVDRLLFSALYENGPKGPVLQALSAYQNSDGGFGNALEPDLRTPASQPLAVERAFVILDLLNAFDHPMVLQACDWLDRVSTPQGGVAFALPSLAGYPHSPWMQADNPAAQLNPTASLCAFLIKHRVDHPWVKRASAFCGSAIPVFEGDAFHDVMPVIEFLTQTPDQRAAAEFQLQRLRSIVAHSPAVAYDPAAAGYVQFPLDWAPAPSSYLHSIFTAETLDLHLKALVQKQDQDGGWPVNWIPLSPAVEAEWRGARVIETLNTLKAYAVL